MKPQLVPVIECAPNVLTELKTRLDRFYHDVTDYSAFSAPSDQVHCWTHVADRIRELSASGKQIRILELGAGQSGLGTFLENQSLRASCFWTAQDVATQNSQWLVRNADKVIFGDIELAQVDDMQDIVFSTFVLEHVVNPMEHLNRLAKLVNPENGTIFIFCPRYDFPGYMTPSSRHLSSLTKSVFVMRSTYARIRTILTGEPSFLVQTDLAAFYQPFFTDSDAVHWVSLFDLKAWSQARHIRCKTLKIGNPKFPSKDWVVKRLLTVGISMEFGSRLG